MNFNALKVLVLHENCGIKRPGRLTINLLSDTYVLDAKEAKELLKNCTSEKIIKIYKFQ